MSEELKPCPWCRHVDVSVEEWSESDFQMACDNCGATGPMEDTPDKAYIAWNRRAGE
ncbi:Lar family restriction alleviation protein [Luteibacter sp. NPDC031894]|uniref:Lar family restriction alleviation protein n=1 Tax=Luteibacter sp. NPDC031894 TaxID=3390572 RepID=UPI003CFEEAA4